jgi:hypothetical protein
MHAPIPAANADSLKVMTVDGMRMRGCMSPRMTPTVMVHKEG